jgi:hypothetical protein
MGDTRAVQRWTGAVSAHPNGGFVAVGDYLELVRTARVCMQMAEGAEEAAPHVQATALRTIATDLRRILREAR